MLFRSLLFRYYKLIIGIFLIFYSCGVNETNDYLSIKGRFSDSRGETVYIEKLEIKQLVLIDSVRLNSMGEFTFRFAAEDAGFYLIKISPSNFFTLLASPGETVEVSGDAGELGMTYRVRNSPGSELLWRLDSAKRGVFTEFDSLRDLWDMNRNAVNNMEIHAHLDSVANQILDDHKQWLTNQMDKNTGSLSNLIALWQTLGQRAMFSLDDDLEIFEKVQRALAVQHSSHPHVEDLSERILSHKKLIAEKKLTEKRLQEGNKAIELSLPDQHLQIRSLSDFKRKNVLLYFWSARNTQSRYDNMELINLYKRYNRYGFEIFQVCVDTDVKFWETSIRVDQLKHTQVLGNEQVKRLYNLDELPRAFLLDTAGVILHKDITVDELKAELMRLYP